MGEKRFLGRNFQNEASKFSSLNTPLSVIYQIRDKLNKQPLIAFDATTTVHRQGPMRCRFAAAPRVAVALR